MKLNFFNKFSTKLFPFINKKKPPEFHQEDAFFYGTNNTITIASSLLGNARRKVRTRQAIYDKWATMEADGIISTAITLLVSAALGGHETTGKVVFIEKTAAAKENKKLEKIADEIEKDLNTLFDRIAFQMAYSGAVFGDSYARIYAKEKVGVIDLSTDELLRAPLVVPYEMSGKTVGYQIFLGEKMVEKLDATQIARLKMPRTNYVPQYEVIGKSLKSHIEENDLAEQKILPSLAGGSFLYNAEEAWENLISALIGLLGQRWMDGIDEQIVTANVNSMTKEQQQRFLNTVKNMLQKSKNLAESAIKYGKPVLERIFHILPVNDEKQILSLSDIRANSRPSNITIDDVMLHAKLLAGALGIDLSMLGFADQLAGGLGEGGFFRVSAQIAERSRVIRTALSDFFNHVIDVHTLYKYGFIFKESERPVIVNYFGSISALEKEKQQTRMEAMSAGATLVQTMQMLKELGADKEIMENFLTQTMMLDEDQAKLFAKIVDLQPPEPVENDDSENDKEV